MYEQVSHSLLNEILDELKPDIRKKREELLRHALQREETTAIQPKPSLFQRYQNSHWMRKMQRVKKIPYIGSSLLFVKHKILKWGP